jgi:hypothetical protein
LSGTNVGHLREEDREAALLVAIAVEGCDRVTRAGLRSRQGFRAATDERRDGATRLGRRSGRGYRGANRGCLVAGGVGEQGVRLVEAAPGREVGELGGVVLEAAVAGEALRECDRICVHPRRVGEERLGVVAHPPRQVEGDDARDEHGEQSQCPGDRDGCRDGLNSTHAAVSTRGRTN